MNRRPLPPPAAARRPPAFRTYLVSAIGAAAGGGVFVRPLGTVAAPRRSLARQAARALYPSVGADEIRVTAAAGAPAGLLAGALAADGAHALAGQ